MAEKKSFIERNPIVRYAFPMVAFFLLVVLTDVATNNNTVRAVSAVLSLGFAIYSFYNIEKWTNRIFKTKS